MEVSFSDTFIKAFRKRIKATDIEPEFWSRLEIFIADPYDPKLKTHKLSGKLKGLWGFSIDYKLRVVFFFTQEKPKKSVLVDIGTHDEVY
jgi:mRNA-degrading endonuclease YafQ of YafQ-DinJ toxin-antitoxin module